MTKQSYTRHLGKLMHIQARIDQAIILIDEAHKHESLLSDVEREKVVEYEERLIALQEQLQDILAFELVSLSARQKSLGR